MLYEFKIWILGQLNKVCDLKFESPFSLFRSTYTSGPVEPGGRGDFFQILTDSEAKNVPSKDLLSLIDPRTTDAR